MEERDLTEVKNLKSKKSKEELRMSKKRKIDLT